MQGFTRHRIATNGLSLNVLRAGQGAPLILLHGFPQNHRAWARVAPTFARHFDVIVPDLRGYGESDAPPDDPAHTTYSKRTMAQDILGLMDALGLPRAHILAHDRGARVAYRLAFDHPARVDRLGLIEILPTADYWRAMDAGFAMTLWHWPFLAQPAPLPETLIGAAPQAFLDLLMTRWTLAKSLAGFPPEALASYRAQMADPARLAAMCADYRAGATRDRAHDEATLAAGHRLTAPLHVLWAETGFPARAGDPLAAWGRWAQHVTGSTCQSGHFVMDEAPEAVLSAFFPHFA